MKIDIAAVFAGKLSFSDAIRDIQHKDLYSMVNELFDEIESLLANASDGAVVFVPRDPAASDQSEQGWTMGHVIAHLTATLEEGNAVGAMLARGVEFEGRLRYEVPWEERSTIQKVQARLQESRRMNRAFLDAWPDEPHLDVTITRIPRLGPLNAVGSSVLSIGHGQTHLEQLREILRQYEHAKSL